MKITNEHHLPKAFVNMANDQREVVDGTYSVTELLKSTRQILLTRRHHAEITVDVADMIWMLFGTAVHHILEQHVTGENEFAEERLYVEMGNGITLTGQIDLYDIHKGLLEDWKTASVWKVIFGDYEDWQSQAEYYAYLLWRHGLPCTKANFWAILKDHSKADARRKGSEYPQLPVKRKTFEFNKDKDMVRIETEICHKLFELSKAVDLPDEQLSMCTEKERWNKGSKYAVIKNGRKTALRVLDSERAALDWAQANGGDYIEERLGEDKRCLEYCSCAEFCDYWIKNYKDKQN